MTEKELKSLRRTDLLEMLIESEKRREEETARHAQEEADLKAQIEELNALLASRQVKIAESGNLAEACLKLNDVFDSAQSAADQYLENILYRYQNIDSECQERVASCQEAAMAILKETKEKCDMLEEKANEVSYEILRMAEQRRLETEEECEEMKRQAKAEADQYFESKNGKLQQVLDTYSTMETLFASLNK